jgi:potassium-transporting ATPase KdpC subunit
MIAHMRANLVLIVLSLVICSVLYPLALLGVGQGLFPTKASGSLVVRDGKPVGSGLIAQEFKGDEWFQSRPSAAGYNAAASGGSNWGANNPKLRDRVAGQLGGSARYKSGTRTSSVQQDIETWFAADPARLAAWVKSYPGAAANWLADAANAKAVEAWAVANPGDGDFFERYAAKYPGTFPTVEKDAIVPARTGAAIQAAFFESWLVAEPTRLAELEPAPADAATASGSGLDPHITLANARGQADRVVVAWAAKTKKPAAEVRAAVETALTKASFSPLLGLAGGEPLVNVLEVNLELADLLAP